MVDIAFAGFATLPATTELPWWEILGIEEGASRREIDAAYINQIRIRRPDVDGDCELFLDVQEAYKQATDRSGASAPLVGPQGPVAGKTKGTAR